MISRPTTEQILLDCRRELLEVVLPAVSDPVVQVSVQMLEAVLRNAATRSAHEIAWMQEEADGMELYARSVAAEVVGDEALAAALAALEAGRSTSLHLDDVVVGYARAGEACSCAIEAASTAQRPDLVAEGAALLRARTDRELEIKGEWVMVGRG